MTLLCTYSRVFRPMPNLGYECVVGLEVHGTPRLTCIWVPNSGKDDISIMTHVNNDKLSVLITKTNLKGKATTCVYVCTPFKTTCNLTIGCDCESFAT